MRFATPNGDFTETVEFPVEIPQNASTAHAIDLLSIVASVSYAKASGPGIIDIGARALTLSAAAFITSLFDEGMREFAHHNGFPLRTTFALADHSVAPARPVAPRSDRHGVLIPVGGGRDSAVVATALADAHPILMSVGANPYSARIAERLDMPFHVVTRAIDPALLVLNAGGAPNGHVPVTAINSLIAIVLAEALAMESVVMANEYSSSAPTRIVDGTSINHQFSKSIVCESSLRRALDESGIGVQYFSALRDRRDREIARVFMEKCAPLHTAFMSCNRAMVRDEARRSDGWCGSCPKCRSVFLSLAPWSDPSHMTGIFGSDLLDESDQMEGFAALLDTGEKPFECVGEVLEARRAMALLARDPAWRHHVVVQAIAKKLGEPSLISESPIDPEHHMTPDVAAAMEAFFS